MMETYINPFRPTRWEHHRDGRPLIWFTDTAEELTGDKSTYVYGSRGVGKTTLLKGICWEDLLFNDSLRLQRRLPDFRHVGIYIRFPDHVSSSMSYMDWSSVFPHAPDPRQEYHRFFTLAVELICAERMLESCHSLRLNFAMSYQPGQELRIVDDFIGEYPDLLGFVHQRPQTFLDLARLIRNAVRRMNEACGRGTLLEFVTTLPPREPYQLLSFLSERIAESVRIKTQFGDQPTTFKFCLDDCEVLSAAQRTSVNTLVRLSRSPVSWVISSVGTTYDDNATFIESQPLTDADRRVISLDERDILGFRQLCQSVVSLRLLFSLWPEISQDKLSSFFNFDQRLGTRDVNDMMGVMIRRSSGPFAKEIKAAAERLTRAVRKANPKAGRKYSIPAGRLPYYETYILLHWRGREESFRDSFSADDVERLDSFGEVFTQIAFHAWLRRKQQNALLHFASMLRIRRLPLSGANTIVTLADSSIRDFLEIMGEVFDAWVQAQKLDLRDTATLERFVASGSRIGADIQTSGIYAASASYVAGVSHRSEIDADVVSRLVSGLGHYTAMLQSDSSDARIFGSAERGVFLIDYPEVSSTPTRDVAAAVRQAELAGYLRPVETPKALRSTVPGSLSKAIAFRLHRRFSPHFRFSFRGAYEVVRLDATDLAALCFGADSISPFQWARAVASTKDRLVSSQILLPLSDGAEFDL
jgi:hypothetical protein